MNNIIRISASLALTAGMMFTANNFPHDPTNKILLDIDGNKATYLTKQDTVGDFLRERGVTLIAEDQINLPVSAEIKGNETVLIQKALPVTVKADGQEIKVNTIYKDVRSLLSSLGIALEKDDRMNVALTDPVTADLEITIQRIVVQEETQILPVSHSVVKLTSKELARGKETVQTEGSDGQREVITRYTYIDGKEVASEVVGDALIKAPVNETILIGSKAPAVAKKPQVKTVKTAEKKTATVKRISKTTSEASTSSTDSNQNWKNFTLTFYTNLPSENGGYSITATGKSLRFGMVASNYYSMGKKIYLTGYGTMTVEDRGGANFNSSSRLDVFIPRKSGESNSAYLNRVNNMGIRTVKGYVK